MFEQKKSFCIFSSASGPTTCKQAVKVSSSSICNTKQIGRPAELDCKSRWHCKPGRCPAGRPFGPSQRGDNCKSRGNAGAMLPSLKLLLLCCFCCLQLGLATVQQCSRGPLLNKNRRPAIAARSHCPELVHLRPDAQGLFEHGATPLFNNRMAPRTHGI